jgi:O-methyltransferase involved in polyketide biosynthesis
LTDAANTSDNGLAITALYTAQTWKWARLDGAELFGTWSGRDVFNATNLALAIAHLFRRDLPSLRHSLVQRHTMIDRLLAESGCAQVLELGAGLSRRGASVTIDPRLRYVEVDLPVVVAKKCKLLARSKQGREVAARDNFVLVGADLRTLDLAGLVAPGPVFVIAEGVMMYLDSERQSELWSRIAALFAERPGSVLTFDLVPFCEQPKPGAVGRMLERLFKRFSRGATFAFDDRTRQDIVTQLRTCGFQSIDLYEPASAPPRWQVPFLTARTQTLVFTAR